jgi:hypothetical protein
MIKLILFIALLSQASAFSQTAFSFLELNNVNATVSSGGTFFQNQGAATPGYEYPKGSGNHLIYANSFWFGGRDINDNVKLSGQQYEFGKDLFPGPLTIDGGADVTSSTALIYDQVYTVTKAEVDYHAQNFYIAGYVAPTSITDWPAHGDVGLDQDFYLAPFVDVNQDQVYTPEFGDYPLIRGGIASYVIMNDKLDLHTQSGGEPIGIECHFMFYQYASSDDLNNTTFVNIKLINRGTQTIYDFSVGGLLDADLGDYTDDYMGSDSALNLIYSYNSLNTDGSYGVNPPAVGLVSLNHDLAVAGTYVGNTGPTSLPVIANDYFMNMSGYYKDGTAMTEGGTGYGGTTPSTFQFHGDPNVAGEWSEYGEANVFSDRRLFYATETSTLVPLAEVCYDFAIVVGDGGDHLENVTNLKTATSFVQDFYDNQNFICENYEGVMSLNSNETFDFVVYPQPVTSGFKINAPAAFDYEITTLEGKFISKAQNIQPNTMINPFLSSGVYLIKVSIGNVEHIQKIVFE